MCPNIHAQTQDLPSLAVPANAKMPKTHLVPTVVSSFYNIYGDKFLYNNQLHALISQIYFGMKLLFRTVPLSIIRRYSLYTHQWYMSHRLVDSFRAAAGSGWNCSSIMILLKSCLQTRKLYSNIFQAHFTILNPSLTLILIYR
jgi:hypothetical protein